MINRSITKRSALLSEFEHIETGSPYRIPRVEAAASQISERELGGKDESDGIVPDDFTAGSVKIPAAGTADNTNAISPAASLSPAETLPPAASFPTAVSSATAKPDITESIRELETLRAIQAEHREQLQKNRRAAIEKKRRTRQLVLLGKVIEESFPGTVSLNEDEMHRFAAGLAAEHRKGESSVFTEIPASL